MEEDKHPKILAKSYNKVHFKVKLFKGNEQRDEDGTLLEVTAAPGVHCMETNTAQITKKQKQKKNMYILIQHLKIIILPKPKDRLKHPELQLST